MQLIKVRLAEIAYTRALGLSLSLSSFRESIINGNSERECLPRLSKNGVRDCRY